jgi:hypothetical protein
MQRAAMVRKKMTNISVDRQVVVQGNGREKFRMHALWHRPDNKAQS